MEKKNVSVIPYQQFENGKKTYGSIHGQNIGLLEKPKGENKLYTSSVPKKSRISFFGFVKAKMIYFHQFSFSGKRQMQDFYCFGCLLKSFFVI